MQMTLFDKQHERLPGQTWNNREFSGVSAKAWTLKWQKVNKI